MLNVSRLFHSGRQNKWPPTMTVSRRLHLPPNADARHINNSNIEHLCFMAHLDATAHKSCSQTFTDGAALFTFAIMNRARPPICIFLLFALLARISNAYAYDEDFRPCEEDKCFVEIHSDVPRCWVHGGNQDIHYMSPIDGGSHSIPNGCWRSNIFGGAGYLVAYPSIGGVVFLKNPSAVDLQHLGLPNTHDTTRSPDEDDDIATRMVQFGAQWWPNWDLYFRHRSRIDTGIFYDYHFPSKVHVAFPTTGGVWVANFTQDALQHQYDEDKVFQPWLPHAPDLWDVRMRYALTMDDKSEVMKDMGATFYISADEVPGLAKTVDAAISLFEPFRERLEHMEDSGYRRRFCTDYMYEDEDEDEDTVNEQPDRPRWGIRWLFHESR